MNSSPYFPVTGRLTRSATRGIVVGLSTKQKSSRKHVKIEYSGNGDDRVEQEGSSDNDEGKVTAFKRRKNDRTKGQARALGWEPSNWREQLANIHEMRKSRDAPVDSQGCEKTADTSQSPEVRSTRTINVREFKKLRRQLQRKRHIKIELCVKLSLLGLLHVDHVVQNRRTALSLAWYEWFSCKGKE